MPVTVYLRGDQIATYSNLQSGGNNDDMRVVLEGVRPFGTANDMLRVEVRQVNASDTGFRNGQWVDIYRVPDDSNNPQPIYSSLNPQHDQFQGRASSEAHVVFTSQKIVFDVSGVDAGRMQYGPGAEPTRNELLPFEKFPSSLPSRVPPASMPEQMFRYTPGSLVETATGQRPVETLQVGDLISTTDEGFQPLRWIGKKTVSGTGHMAPVLIKAGALGNVRDMRVSQQHRMLVRSLRTNVIFGEPEVLVAAKHLVDGTSILVEQVPYVTYVHLAFDAHHILKVDGCLSESLLLDGESILHACDAQRRELLELFPDIPHQPQRMARRCLRRWEAELLAA